MIDWQTLDVGDHRVTCPSCGRNPRDRTCGVTVEPDGRGVAHCFRCGRVEAHRPERSPIIRPGKAISRPVAQLKRETLSEYGLTLFAASVPLPGTVGEQYLRARGCVIPPDDSDLRFNPALRHPSGYTGPGLVALVTHALTGALLTLHRTWIRADGTKADIDPPRLLLGGHRKAGGVIRLWPDEAVTTSLAIGEGIESCLSLAHAHQPVWSCIDAGNLTALPVLGGVECLLIGADADDAGMQAANTCADRWAAAGVEVRIVAPRVRKADLNDICMGRVAA